MGRRRGPVRGLVALRMFPVSVARCRQTVLHLRDGFELPFVSRFRPYSDEIAVRSLRLSLLVPNHSRLAIVFVPYRAGGHDEVFCDERRKKGQSLPQRATKPNLYESLP